MLAFSAVGKKVMTKSRLRAGRGCLFV
jgi:hypothetical protein